MDRPSASTHSGRAPSDARSTDAFASGCTIDLAGVAVACTADDPAHAEGLAGVLAGAPPGTGPAGAALRFGRRVTPLPDRPPDHGDAKVSWWEADAGTRLLQLRDELAVITGTRARLEADGDAAACTMAVRRLLGFVLAEVLGGFGLVVVHAAAVATDGRALLLTGASGSGKSSVVHAAGECGWGVLADDLVALRRVDDHVEVRGIPRPLAVPRALLDGRDRAGVAGDGRDRAELATPATGAWWELAAVVELVHAAPGTDPALAPRAGRSTLDRLRSAALAAPTPTRFARTFPVVGAASGLPAWTLAHRLTVPAAVAPTVALLAGALGAAAPPR